MATASSPAAHVSATELDSLHDHMREALPAFLDELARLVNVDCGSYTKSGVDEVGDWTAARFDALGADVVRHAHDSLGGTVVATWAGPRDGPSVLLIGHMDTVFAAGTAAERPFTIKNGIATGPGVTDMKSGLLAGLHAVQALQSLGPLPFRRLVFVANPDEEIGSPSSSPIIRDLATEADVCLVLECARENGDIVSARKGTFDLRLTVSGRAAHAGVEPEKGRSAILEAARLVGDLHALNDRWPGVTANVGVISGGTRPNVVAERCVLELDLRATVAEHLDAARGAVDEIAGRTVVPDVTVSVEESSGHRPMEKLERSGRLVDHTIALADRLGFSLKDTTTGGASDANTTSGMGIPTLDGLGPVGGNDHSPAEYLEVDSIVPRTTLLAALLLEIARDPVVAEWRRTPAGR
jgi:glutamate carboxypeptidase